MIVRGTEATRRSFLGVDFLVLAVGDESMVTKMLYKREDDVPPHSHPNEQSGYVVSGSYILEHEGGQQTLVAGDSYSIPRDVVHSMQIVEPGEVVDVFTPPRQDYL